MGREEQLLSAHIADSFQEAEKAVRTVSQIIFSLANFDDIEKNIELREQEDVLQWYIEKLFIDVAMLAERMALPLLAQKITKEYKELDRKQITEMLPPADDDNLYSPVLSRIRRYYTSLAVMTNGKSVTGLDTFRTILENTPAIIKLRGIEPKSEADVQRAVFEILKVTFHDAVREISLGQILKTYKPDLGVRSLMAAAEYKFADTETEVRSCLDGIYADMKGYNGHYDWRTFFAVIYTTDNMVHSKQLEEEFRGVRAELNWTPIVVVGKGARVKRVRNLRSRS